MGVGEGFKTFCSNLAITKRATISDRYKLITRRLNLEFWNNDSRIYHSIQAGSYGRETATAKTSDVDMGFWLPYEDYVRFNGYAGNGQSAMLQEVRTAIKKTYPINELKCQNDTLGQQRVQVISERDQLRAELDRYAADLTTERQARLAGLEERRRGDTRLQAIEEQLATLKPHDSTVTTP